MTPIPPFWELLVIALSDSVGIYIYIYTLYTWNSISTSKNGPVRRRLVQTGDVPYIHVKRQHPVFNVKLSEDYDHVFNQKGSSTPSLLNVLIVHFVCRPQ